jgi:hypothetical protein
MNDNEEFLEESHWSRDETILMSTLARERIPSHELKGRTIAALHQNGFLASPSGSPRRTIALLAAASVIFIAGALVGYFAARRAPAAEVPSRMANREQVAQAESATNTQPVRHVVWY